MNLSKVERLIALLRQNGVYHFKTHEVEISLGAQTHPSPVLPQAKPESKAVAPEPQAAPPKEMAIPHHVNEVASLLKLNDEALVDKLFPDYSNMEPKE